MSGQTVRNAEFMVPMLICRYAAAEVEFCKAAFRAVELSRRSKLDGSVVHATLRIGKALIMVHGEVETLQGQSPPLDSSSPVVIYAYVQEQVDEVVPRAVAAGATVLVPVNDMPWGARLGRIIDRAGHMWNVTNRPVETTSEGSDAD